MLSCISLNNQECRIRPQIVNVNGNNFVVFPFSVKKVHAVVVATISIIHMQNCLFLML